MRKPRKTIKVICRDCGITFDAKARSNLRCEKCKKAWANQQSKNNKGRKRLQTQTVKRVKTRPKMSIREVLIALEKYNREHKTHLSYGQFVALMEGGRIIETEE